MEIACLQQYISASADKVSRNRLMDVFKYIELATVKVSKLFTVANSPALSTQLIKSNHPCFVLSLHVSQSQNIMANALCVFKYIHQPSTDYLVHTGRRNVLLQAHALFPQFEQYMLSHGTSKQSRKNRRISGAASV